MFRVAHPGDSPIKRLFVGMDGPVYKPLVKAKRISRNSPEQRGYNVDYDWRVVCDPNIRRICVLALSRAFFPGLDSYSQSALLYHLARDRARGLLKNGHSAMHLGDALPNASLIGFTGRPTRYNQRSRLEFCTFLGLSSQRR